jgi:hypothetical protein
MIRSQIHFLSSSLCAPRFRFLPTQSRIIKTSAMHTSSGYAWDKWEPGMESLKRVSPAAGEAGWRGSQPGSKRVHEEQQH